MRETNNWFIKLLLIFMPTHERIEVNNENGLNMTRVEEYKNLLGVSYRQRISYYGDGYIDARVQSDCRCRLNKEYPIYSGNNVIIGRAGEDVAIGDLLTIGVGGKFIKAKKDASLEDREIKKGERRSEKRKAKTRKLSKKKRKNKRSTKTNRLLRG